MPSDDLVLTPAMFHILLALADGARHGYAIMQDVESRTNGEVQLPPGTLYRAIKQLLEARLIERIGPVRDRAAHETRRQSYRLSRLGRNHATHEAQRLARVVALARAKRLIPRDAPA